MLLGKGFGILAWIAQLLAVCFWLYAAGLALERMAEDKTAAMVMALFSLAMATGTAYCLYRQLKWVKEDKLFKEWLIVNAEKIRNQHILFYRAQRISLNTELVRHHLVFSALIVSFRMQTRWTIKGKESRQWHALACCLYTLVYGWWGFPFGIYWTLVALVKNLKGSTSVRVQDLLQPSPAKPVGFGDRFQTNFLRRLRAGFFIDEQPVGILPSETIARP